MFSRQASLWGEQFLSSPRTRSPTMLRSGRSFAALAGVASALALAGAASAPAAVPSRTAPAARGLAPLVVQGATAAGAPGAAPISVTLALEPRDAAGLDALV